MKTECSPLLFLGLGGTKIAFGGFGTDARVFPPLEIGWRSCAEFQAHGVDRELTAFCGALLSSAETYLSRHGVQLCKIARIGVAFPGPQRRGKWISNNLTKPFVKGVDLEQALITTYMRRYPGRSEAPRVSIMFDAQCDAAGELVHPKGWLRQNGNPDSPMTALVFNWATGIAAGLIVSGKLLQRDEDFSKCLGPSYDGGAGQLGRHLWLNIEDSSWIYKFEADGGTPKMPPSYVRLTDRLAGPAVAGRLLAHVLDEYGYHKEILPSNLSESLIRRVARLRSKQDSSFYQRRLAEIMRLAPAVVSQAIFEWSSREISRFPRHPIGIVLWQVATEVADDFVGAIRVLRDTDRWGALFNFIILTGGFGIRFLAPPMEGQSDAFLDCVRSGLGRTFRVVRSRIYDSVQRELAAFAWS
jgi:hypothetical protein